jgi:hypothetical protein
LSHVQPDGSNEGEKVWIGEDVKVLPLGLINNSSLSLKIFGDPKPGDFTEEELK